MKDASIYAVVRSQPPSPPRRSSHALPSLFLPSLSRRGQCHYSFPLDKSKTPKKKKEKEHSGNKPALALLFTFTPIHTHAHPALHTAPTIVLVFVASFLHHYYN